MDNRLIFSTDAQGRFYRLTTDRKATLIAETGEGEAIRLASSQAGLLAATGNMGKLYRLTGDSASDGFYEAPVHDANTVASWGRSERGVRTCPPEVQVAFRTRTGNSARPDSTWSDWSHPMNDPSKSVITSPNARYIQWRVEFKSANRSAPGD